jgi:hypothetical protein
MLKISPINVLEEFEKRKKETCRATYDSHFGFKNKNS